MNCFFGGQVNCLCMICLWENINTFPTNTELVPSFSPEDVGPFIPDDKIDDVANLTGDDYVS